MSYCSSPSLSVLDWCGCSTCSGLCTISKFYEDTVFYVITVIPGDVSGVISTFCIFYRSCKHYTVSMDKLMQHRAPMNSPYIIAMVVINVYTEPHQFIRVILQLPCCLTQVVLYITVISAAMGSTQLIIQATDSKLTSRKHVCEMAAMLVTPQCHNLDYLNNYFLSSDGNVYRETKKV